MFDSESTGRVLCLGYAVPYFFFEFYVIFIHQDYFILIYNGKVLPTMASNIVCQSAMKFLKIPHFALLVPSLQSNLNMEMVRHTHKHWNPKWKRLRREKVVKMDLPDFHEDNDNLTEDQMRTKLKEKGVKPMRGWSERPLFVSCTGGVFEPYVPAEGDGKRSIVSPTGAKQSLQFIEKKSKSMMAIRKIKSFDEDFVVADFCDKAQDIYVKAHEYMALKDGEKIQEYITERAYPEMLHNLKLNTIRWSFLGSLEPPRLVHARCTDIITKENIYSQITVRFHTQQKLAIYDRFGRLMYGSEILAKDVLEYIVFEKHLANIYGTWRLHDKIIPDWMPPKEPRALTFERGQHSPEIKLTNEDQESGVSKVAPEETAKDSAPATT